MRTNRNLMAVCALAICLSNLKLNAEELTPPADAVAADSTAQTVSVENSKPAVDAQPEQEKPASNDEAREKLLASPQMQEAIGWTNANLAIRAGDGPQLTKEFHEKLAKSTTEELEDFLMQNHFARMEVQNEELQFNQMRSQSFDRAYSFHLQNQQIAMKMAAERKAATFKKFDSGQDRYNNGFHGYRGPRGPLISGGFFFGGRW